MAGKPRPHAEEPNRSMAHDIACAAAGVLTRQSSKAAAGRRKLQEGDTAKARGRPKTSDLYRNCTKWSGQAGRLWPTDRKANRKADAGSAKRNCELLVIPMKDRAGFSLETNGGNESTQAEACLPATAGKRQAGLCRGMNDGTFLLKAALESLYSPRAKRA